MERKKNNVPVRLGNNRSTQRYFDSIKAIKFTIEKINDDGLMKIVGIYKNKRTFRHFYSDEDHRIMSKKISELQKDIRAEFSAFVNEVKDEARN